MWFTPLPNRDNPRQGGVVMHILPHEGDRLSVGLDLTRLLSLQKAVAHLVEVVVTHSLPARKTEPVNPITEEEIQAATKLLDTELEAMFTEKKEDKDNG